MKLKVTVEFEDQVGEAVVPSTTIEVDIPDFEEFTGPDRLGVVFNQCEQSARYP